MRAQLRAFIVLWDGAAGCYAATSAGKARMLAARAINDAYGLSIGKALVAIRCRRAPWRDYQAEARKVQGYLPAWM